MKYFTPNLEDLRVGYKGQYRVGDKFDWQDFTLTSLATDREGYGAAQYEDYLLEGNLRVQYLSAYELMSYGWELSLIRDEFFRMKKGEINIELRKDFTLIIYKEGLPHEILFKGKCLDINTFNYICKCLV